MTRITLVLSAGLIVLAVGALSGVTKAAQTATSAGSRILFQSIGSAGGDTLYSMKPDGTDAHQLDLHVPGSAISPDWSPDGRRITFVVQLGDAQSIWTADADGRNAKELFHCAGACLGTDYPAWSPDGKSIAFTYLNASPAPAGGPPSGDSIRVINLASKQVRILTESKLPLLIDLARWSPDGKRLVVERDRFADGNETGSRIEIIRARDGKATPITPFSQFAFHPDWARGNLIVFDSYDLLAYGDTAPGASNLFTVRPDGTRNNQLTHFRVGGNRVSAATFTPDGRRIMFTYQVGRTRRAGVIASGGGPIATVRTDFRGPVTHPRLSAAP
jgi:Tol biopolymer transport system component